MLEPRSLKLDILALGLLALTVFLAAALVGYCPADPPNALVYPPGETIENICGGYGAWVSWLLFGALGLGAYYLVATLIVLDAVLLARRQVTDPLLRFAGWLVSLVGVSTLGAMASHLFSPGPVIGGGGYLGATVRGLLEANFASVGGYILTGSLIVGGLLLSTDYLLVRALDLVAWRPLKAVARGGARVISSYVQQLTGRSPVPASAAAESGEPVAPKPRKRKRTDFDESPAEIEREVAIRVAGRKEEPAAETQAASGEPEKAPAAPAEPAESLKIVKPRKVKEKREEIAVELEPEEDPADYELPPLDLLLEGEAFNFEKHEVDVRHKAKILEETFANFGFNVRVVEIQTGPVIAQFEIQLEAGLRLSKITSLADDLAIALKVPSVRIVAPIPGKNTVGVEVPNATRQLVRMRELIEEAGHLGQKLRIPIFLGKDVAGKPLVVDLADMPHLLIAGRTGTGKSVCLNSIIVSILMTRGPDEVRMLMIDPKMVELSGYKSLPHLMHPVVTDMRKAEAILAWAVDKMEERYQYLARAGVRHITKYNQLGEEELMERMQPENEEERRMIPTHMPFIVIVADEMADLMMTAAKEVEQHIIRLAQKSRAVGIHLVLATQKPTVDVITGLIKSNLPARIAFQVASRVDSRVVLDEMGADKLLGNGDMLFLWPGTSQILRGQGTYLADEEINRVIGAVSTDEPQYVKELVALKAASPEGGSGAKIPDSRDDLYDAAVEVVIREGRGSVSLLQRSLGIGYGRAARLIDYMAEDGIVGTYNGSQAREVLLSLEDWEALRSGQPAGSRGRSAPPTPPKPPRRIVLDDAVSSADARPLSAADASGVSGEESPPWDEEPEMDAEEGKEEYEGEGSGEEEEEEEDEEYEYADDDEG